MTDTLEQNMTLQDISLKQKLFASLVIIGILLVGTIAGVQLVQKEQDFRNFASENVCQAIEPIKCSWSVTNLGDETYSLSQFNARVRVLNIIDGNEIQVGKDLFIEANLNAIDQRPETGFVYVGGDNVIIEAGQEYRCEVQLIPKAVYDGPPIIYRSSAHICEEPNRTQVYVPPNPPAYELIEPEPTAPAYEPSSPGCEDALLQCPTTQTGQPGLVFGNITYQDPRFICASVDDSIGNTDTTCTHIANDGYHVRYHQIKPEDTLSSIYTPSTQGVAPNNQSCSCSSTVSNPICKPPRVLSGVDGYPENNCDDGCNFIFTSPSGESCLSPENNVARVRLLYANGGSVDFDDDFDSTSKKYFSDFNNPLTLSYEYKTPGVYDVSLTCHDTSVGQQRCTKRIVVIGDEISEEPIAEVFEIDEELPACLLDQPRLGVNLDIKPCLECENSN